MVFSNTRDATTVLLKWLVMILLAVGAIAPPAATECFTGKTLPVILQTATTATMSDTHDDMWQAVDVDSTGAYVFLGGWVDMSQAIFVDHTVTASARAPVAACFSTVKGQYTWVKKLVDTSGFYGEIYAVSYVSSSLLILAGVSNDKNKHYVYLVDPLTGSSKQRAFYFQSADTMKPLTRNSIVTSVSDRIYWTGTFDRTSGLHGTDLLQFVGIDFSGGTLTTVAHKKFASKSTTSGQITSALAVATTKGSEVIIMGAGFSAGSSVSSYVLSLIKYAATDGSIKSLDARYVDGNYFADQSLYQSFALLKQQSSVLVGATWSAKSSSRGNGSLLCYMPFSVAWDTLDTANTIFLQINVANDYKAHSQLLDIFMIDTTNKYVYGIQYDWDQKWLVYWRVNFAGATMTALKTYASSQFVMAAVLASSSVATTGSGINIYRVFLAGYIDSSNGSIGYTTSSMYTASTMKVPYLTDNLGSTNTCSTETRLSVSYSVTSRSVSWSSSTFATFSGFSDQSYTPTHFYYEAKDVKGDLLMQQFCYERTGNPATLKFQDIITPTFAYTPNLYLDSPVTCSTSAFTSVATCTNEESFFLQYIDQTYDIAASDIIGTNIVFSVRDPTIPAGQHTLSVYGTLPTGLKSQTAYQITVQVMSGSGTSICSGVLLSCATATDVSINEGTAPSDQTYIVAAAEGSVDITKFIVTSAEGCTDADVVYSITYNAVTTSSIFKFNSATDPLILTWSTSTPSDANTYTVVITGTVTATPSVTKTLQFDVVISTALACATATDVVVNPGTPPSDYTYYIGTNAVPESINRFTVTSAEGCTDANVVYSITYNGSATSSIFTFDSATDPLTLTWSTSTPSDANTYTVVITGTVTATPSVTKTLSFDVVIMDKCDLYTTLLDASSIVDIIYTVGNGQQSFTLIMADSLSSTCWQGWKYTLVATLDTKSITLTSVASATDPSLKFSSSSFDIGVLTNTGVAKTIPLTLNVAKSTVPSFTQQVKFNLIIEVGDFQPPLFPSGDTYNATTLNVTGTAGSAVPFGTPYDLDNDKITCSNSILPASASKFFELDCSSGNLIFSREDLLALQSDSSNTIIKVDITLTDDNSIVQMKSFYTITFLIAQTVTEAVAETTSTTDTPQPGVTPEQGPQHLSGPIIPENVQVQDEVYFTRMTVNNVGLATVVFSEPVLPVMNLTIFDDTVLNVDLKINGDYEMQYYEYTWSVVEFTRTQMQIQIKFAYPLYISQTVGGKGEYLSVSAKEEVARQFFKAERSTLHLYIFLKIPTEVQKEVPPQLGGSPEEIAQLQSAAQAAGDTSKAMMSGGVVVNIILASSLSLVWGMINVQQIIIHISFFSCATPQNVLTFYEGLLEAVNFELFPTENIYKTLAPWFYKGNEETTARLLLGDEVSFEEQDTEADGGSGGAHEKLALLIVVLMALAVSVPCVCLCCFCKRRFKIARIVIEEVRKLLFWNATLQLFMESYFDTSLSSVQALSAGLLWGVYTEYLDSLYIIASMFVCLILPAFVSLFLVCSFYKFRQKKFRQKYKSTLEQLSIRQRFSGLFYALFCYRRLFQVCLIVFLTRSPVFQLQFMPLSVMCVIVILGEIQPFQLPLFRRLEYFNEASILVCCYHYFMFTDFVPDPEIRYSIGKVLIYCTVGNLLFNVSILCYFTAKKISFCYRKIRYECRKKRYRFYDKILARMDRKMSDHSQLSESSNLSNSISKGDIEEIRSPRRNKRRRRQNSGFNQLQEQQQSRNRTQGLQSTTEDQLEMEAELLFRNQILIAQQRNDSNSFKQLDSIPEEDELDYDALKARVEGELDDIWNELQNLKPPSRNVEFQPRPSLASFNQLTRNNSNKSHGRFSSNSSINIPIPKITTAVGEELGDSPGQHQDQVDFVVISEESKNDIDEFQAAAELFKAVNNSVDGRQEIIDQLQLSDFSLSDRENPLQVNYSKISDIIITDSHRSEPKPQDLPLEDVTDPFNLQDVLKTPEIHDD